MESRLGRKIKLAATVAAACALLAGPGHSAEPLVPDFSGLWGRDSLNLESPDSGPGPIENLSRSAAGTMDMNKLVGDYNSPILTPRAAAILKTRGEKSLRGESVPNPHEECRPEPPPLIFAVQFAFEMLQTRDETVLLYSHDNKVRHVHMNVPHPANLQPSGQGDSIGHYEGDSLVIDTVGIRATPISALDWYGTPHSDSLHVVERYRLIDQAAAKTAAARHDRKYRTAPRPNPNGIALDPDYRGKGLQIEVTVEDPEMFTVPWRALVTYQRALGDLWEMSCAENHFEYYTGHDTPIPQTDRPDF
jgi:hypothetical protein